MLHQVGVSFDLYYDARKHKINIYVCVCLCVFVCVCVCVCEIYIYIYIYISRLPTLLFRSLGSGFRVPNHIRLAVLGSLDERNSVTVRVNAVLRVWLPLWIACTEVIQKTPSVFLQ